MLVAIYCYSSLTINIMWQDTDTLTQDNVSLQAIKQDWLMYDCMSSVNSFYTNG